MKKILYILLFLFLTFSIFYTYYENLKLKQQISIHNKNREVKIKEIEKSLFQKNQEIIQMEEELYSIKEDYEVLSNPKIKKMAEKIVIDQFIDINHGNLIKKMIPNGKPLKDIFITDSYGMRSHPVLKVKKFHKGIDLRAKRKTPVYATADGIVRYYHSSITKGYGRVLIISHNYGFETLYGHLNRTKVKVGDFVKKGQLIGLSGNTGRSTGPHLHYEIRFAAKTLNPIHFINWNGDNLDNISQKVKNVPWKTLYKTIKEDFSKEKLDSDSKLILKKFVSIK